MISENKNQGRFHLLAIALIPANMAALFLMPARLWWLSAIIFAFSAFLTYLTLKR
jgi:membrane protein implicated in regulation of membrane protease activity